jgi:hypothetical protein
MKIKNEYSIISQNDGYLVCLNGTPLEKTLFLNKTAAFLWGLLEKEDLLTSQLLDAVLKEFEISTVLALGEIDTFLKIIKENGIIE